MLEMKYFVLKPKGKTIYAIASRAAMMTYAGVINEDNNELSKNLIDWSNNECKLANEEEKLPF